MNKYMMEFIGTFFLFTTIGCTVMLPPAGQHFAPLAIGGMLMVMIFAGGHISGGHYNPAVTLAVFLRGKCPKSDVIPYMAAQAIGAAAAAGIILILKGSPMNEGIQPPLVQSLIAEFLFTFALCTVVLQVATSKGTSGNSFYGLAIGFTVLAGAYSVGWISGGVFNPAVALGATLVGLLHRGNMWIYLVANFAAAIVAASVFKITNPEDKA